jgi:magnesium transporter
MTKRRELSAKKIGLAPGSIVFTGEQREERSRLSVMRYDEASIEETTLEDGGRPDRPPTGPGVHWVNLVGLHDIDAVAGLGEEFGVHPLALEDTVSVSARPQAADYGDHIFTSVRMLSLDSEGETVDEHVALVLGPNWVLTFQEREGDVFEFVRDRIRRSVGRIRKRGSDYLWYALLDAVVDHYILVVDHLAGEVEELEEHVWEEETDDEVPSMVQAIRRRSMVVRRALRPLREEVDHFLADGSTLIGEETHLFLRDLREHISALTDSLESIRDLLAAIMEAHLAKVAAKANDVMKVLTIVATIFIPITFIAGVYGMNFQYMPELGFRWAYALVWLVMLGVAGGMLLFFRKRGWL